MIYRFMDDHADALSCWLGHGLSGLTCVHVDAHLDVQDEVWTPRLLADTLAHPDSDDVRGHRDLPWGGLHCGNYLYPALAGGVVSHLVWVVPAPMVAEQPFLPWVRDELLRWTDLRLDEFRGLKQTSRWRAEGELAGRRFTLCRADQLPPLEGPLALDIDVDYFLEEDRVWQTPAELKAQLGLPEPQVLTVATSVAGGYTPGALATLGPDTLATWGIAAADLPLRGERSVDRAARHLTRKQPTEGLAELAELPEDDVVRLYLEAMLQAEAKAGNLALKLFEQLAVSPLLNPREQAQLHFMVAGLLLGQDFGRGALKAMEAARRLSEPRADFAARYALALRNAGQFSAATRAFREALRMRPDHYSSLNTTLELARTYSQLGQSAMALATHRQLQATDPTGHFAALSVLEENK